LGPSSQNKIIALIICLLAASAFIYRQAPPRQVSAKPAPLQTLMAAIPGWELIASIPLQEEIIASLALDDYAYNTFAREGNTVSLYIGYYFTKGKVGASHSPLVCFPGQGWKLSEKENRTVTVQGHALHLAQMVAERNGRRELLQYWFQAYDLTSPGTFAQKINTLRTLLLHGKEDNAFVRLTIPIDDNNASEATRIGDQFIQNFYPIFLQHITQQELPAPASARPENSDAP
jgi:EpsI family protein